MQLTDSEAKMLREHCKKLDIGCYDSSEPLLNWFVPVKVLVALSELLLAAKVRLAKVGQDSLYREGLNAISVEEAILKADLGDLFEGKS